MGVVALWSTFFFFVSAKRVCGTSSCPNIVNMAATRSAEVNVGSTRVVIDQEFSDLPYFTPLDALTAMATKTCVPADPTLNYAWTVDIQATGFIAYAVVLSEDQDIGNETFLLEFGFDCCAKNSTQSICYARCESVSIVNVTQPPYYAHQMTCQDQNVTGRGVRISKRAESPQATSVCGVKVAGCLHDERLLNMAEGKAASQSSLWGSRNSPASLAVDGSTKQNFLDADKNPRCTHTKHEDMTDVPKWWCVDIGQSVSVSHVLIYNRNGATAERLHDFAVQVGQDDEQGDVRYTECYYHNGSAGSVTNVTCGRPMCGRYVCVMKSQNDTDSLTLCEVEVYATAAPQIYVDDIVQTTTLGMYTNTAAASSSDTTSTGVTTQTTRVDSDTHTSHTEATESETTDPGPTETATYPDTTSTKTTKCEQSTTHLTNSPTENSPSNSTRNGPQTNGPQTNGPQTNGPQTNGPQTNGPQTNGPQTNAVTAVTESTNSDQSSTQPAYLVHNLPKCRCLPSHLVQNSTLLKDQADKKAKEIAQALAVKRSSTAMYLRSKISASDDRPSAKMAGSAAVIVLTVVTMLVMFGDAVSVLKHFVRMLKLRSRRVTTSKD